MSSTNETLTNITVGQQNQLFLEIVFSCIVTTLTCCVFLFINVTMLFTLRSKPVFGQTSRYILLYNLLFADTLQMAQSQLMFLLSACRITLLYPICGVLVSLATLLTLISPLTLVAMSLERYVAVCYPLRHATIITVRNTALAVCVVWTLSLLNVLIEVVLMLRVRFQDLLHLQMEYSCNKEKLTLDPISDLYAKAFSYFLFVLAAGAFIFSYIGVTVVAQSASTDKASAEKARKTLVLHLVQLGLSVSSTIHNPIFVFIYKTVDSVIVVRIRVVIYLCIIILPRCLSSFIYGLRDHTIRPVLMLNLRCQWKCQPFL